jgi:Uma2 family endonuclease
MAVIEGLTIEDYEKLPDALALNHELVDGELVDVSGNIGEHNDLKAYLVEILHRFVREHNLGKISTEQEFEFDENAHGPDVSYIVPEKVALWDRKRRVQLFVPDLAVEIISPSNTWLALMKKARHYRRCGTQEVWVVSIDDREIRRLSPDHNDILDENAMLETPLIPGFSIRLGDLLDQALA